MVALLMALSASQGLNALARAPSLLQRTAASRTTLHATFPQIAPTSNKVHGHHFHAEPCGHIWKHMRSGGREADDRQELCQDRAARFAQFAASPCAAHRHSLPWRLGPWRRRGWCGHRSAVRVAKLYNDPLLRSTISIVARKAAAMTAAPMLSPALLLALVVGIAQGLVYGFFRAPS